MTARELSALVHIREKDVAPHLEHLEKSLRRSGKRLVIEPAECLQCGFRFEKRRRFTKPSACPRCRCQQDRSSRLPACAAGRPGFPRPSIDAQRTQAQGRILRAPRSYPTPEAKVRADLLRAILLGRNGEPYARVLRCSFERDLLNSVTRK